MFLAHVAAAGTQWPPEPTEPTAPPAAAADLPLDLGSARRDKSSENCFSQAGNHQTAECCRIRISIAITQRRKSSVASAALSCLSARSDRIAHWQAAAPKRLSRSLRPIGRGRAGAGRSRRYMAHRRRINVPVVDNCRGARVCSVRSYADRRTDGRAEPPPSAEAVRSAERPCA